MKLLASLLCLSAITLAEVIIEETHRSRRAVEDHLLDGTLQHNYKFAFSGSSNDYVVSEELTKDLVDFTVSFWVKVDGSADAYMGFINYATGDNFDAIRIYESANYIYIMINKQSTRCGGIYFQSGYWRHVLLTWSNIRGTMILFVDGHKHCGGMIRRGDSIKKGGNFTLGQYVKSLDPYYRDSSYSWKGEIAYVNVYNNFINSTDEYYRIRNMTMSDDDAVMSWKQFRYGIHGNTQMFPEFDLYRNAFTHLECNTNSMTLYLRRQGFPDVDPEQISLLYDSCGATMVNETHIVMSTALSDCGTRVNYTSSYATYSNQVRLARGPFLTNLAVDVDVINRRPVSEKQTRLTFECKYEVSKMISLPIYAAHIDNIHNSGHGDSRFDYRITLYHSRNFTNPYTKTEYPIQTDMGETVYVEVAVVVKDIYMDNWIKECRATPSAAYLSSDAYHDLISDGCPNKRDESIQFYSTTDVGIKRFSFGSFHFNKHPSAVVFLHCWMELCDPGNKESRCAQGLSVC